MRQTTTQTQNAWTSPFKIGDQRPVVRATMQRAQLRRESYNTRNAPGGDYDHERDRKGVFTTFLMGGNEAIREIRNIRTFNWSRSTDQDIAECTLTILNTDTVAIGVDKGVDGFEIPGMFTPGRGPDATDDAVTRWGYSEDMGWNDALVPDRLMRTYEGYGADYGVAPGDDEHLYQSGTWIVDEVAYSANGDLVITARDAGRLLLDQIAFPPVIPRDDYPLLWSTLRVDEIEGREPTGGAWKTPEGQCSSSNELYVGEGIVDKPKYVGPGGSVQGHRPQHAITGGSPSFWLSTGQTDPMDKVWWEIDLNDPVALNAVRMQLRGGPYKVYVSLHNGTRWLGKKNVPYDVSTEGIDLEADIPFVKYIRVDKGLDYDLPLPRRYDGIQKIRLTFTDLRRFMSGANYPWRAGLRDFKIYTADSVGDLGFDDEGTILRPVGNISDFSSAVRWVCAWAGFYWSPKHDLNYIRYSTFGPRRHFVFGNNMAALPKGRVWGSFQNTGTAPIADLTEDNFDKQPLFETIQVIKEMTGFWFSVDEAGGIIWRLPNIYEYGNWISRHHKEIRMNPTRSLTHVTIDEDTTLVDYTARVHSRNLRERVGVTDAQGKYGAVIRGYRPPNWDSPHLRRAAIWSDENFASNREARVAADLIAARQMMDYRRGKLTIWGNPAIQVDDQVRIFERVSNETYFHYVAAITSTIDMEAGTWDYEMETHWLGEGPTEGEWLVNTELLSDATKHYLSLLGGVDDDSHEDDGWTEV